MVTNKELVLYLQSHAQSRGLVDYLKIRYRPIICPFQPLLEQVRPGDKIADIGCGSGQFALLAQEFTDASRITGIEVDAHLVDNAKTLCDWDQSSGVCQFLVYDGNSFPPEIGEADILFLIDVLHHVPKSKQEVFLHGLFESMRPGARLMVKDIDAASPLVIFNKIHDLVFSGEIGHERSADDVSEWASRIGFRVLKKLNKREMVYPHFFLSLEKPGAAAN